MEFIKKNFAILLAFALPILLIAVVALSAYLPSLFLSTRYDFVYSTCTDGSNSYPYRCNEYLRQRYGVVDNALAVNAVDMTELKKDFPQGATPQYANRIFFHDTKKNESREITLAEAQALKLDGLLTSPDGVTVSSHLSRGGGEIFFLFGGGASSYGYYLTKGNSRSKLNLINNVGPYYYQDNFQFIGWVLPPRS